MKKKVESMLSKMHPIETLLTAATTGLVIALVILSVVIKVFF